MELYLKFVGWLAIGLIGLALVLRIVIDELFGDWNVVLEARDYLRARMSAWFSRLEGRTEDRLMELERLRAVESSTTRRIELKREQLRELADVEQRLQPASDR